MTGGEDPLVAGPGAIAAVDAGDARPFDLAGPLPRGVTVLEASAGTGKTYTIAGLAARYVAEGVPLSRVLLVTFTRMATGELRERVRERLVEVEAGLRAVLRGSDPAAGDPVVGALATGAHEEVAERRARLVRSLSDFDAATIATTHGFCQEVLGGLGIAADLEPGVEFVEDLSDLVDEVVDDLYVRAFWRAQGDDRLPFTRAEAGAIAAAAIENPGAELAPARDGVPARRRRLAEAVRAEVERRKRRLAMMSYDDLLTRLADALDGAGGEATAERLRERWDAVLVDEFQDTDPIQWQIMRRAFGTADRALVLIGDPKQAIYSFRGADVYAYLAAADEAAARATLTVNRRSDQGLIEAYDALFGGAKLGHQGIEYREVEAAPAHRAPRLHGAPHEASLRVRIVARDDVERTRYGYARVPAAREHVAEDLAADLAELLASDAEVETRTAAGTTADRERVRPRHVAVLVPTNRTAALVRTALEGAGIPAVINGAGSVFATEPARDWLRLLEALERPAMSIAAHAAALTPFFGWSPEAIAGAGEAEWEDVHRRLHDWARVLREKGVASLMETVNLGEGLPRRVLARDDGERRLTDLRHVGQLLHATASEEQLGVTALTGWLRKRIDEARDDTSDEERSRRLESDAEAIQVLTVHRSKGLEFPIVYAPFLWEPSWIPDPGGPVAFHDPEHHDARTIDLGLEEPAYGAHRAQYLLERRGEDLRLAYVALTRARHQAVIWWAGSHNARDSPLGRLLFARDPEGNVAASGQRTPEDDVVLAAFEALAERAPGCVAVERSTLGRPAWWSPPLAEPASLRAAAFERALDRGWRRTSYSDITAGAHDPRVASEPEEPALADEPDAGDVLAPAPPVSTAPPPDPALAAPSLLAEMPAGVHVGTLVHRLFQDADFAAADLDAELDAVIAAALAGHAREHELGDPSVVRAGLRAAIETPLGPLVGGARLRDVPRADRLDELGFELPLTGGDEPTGRLTLATIRDVLRETLPAGDPFAAYATRLDDEALRQTVRGYLTGSLDLVMRLDGPRFAVVDYKTNWLAGPDEPLTVWHHRPDALAAEMRRRHYGLQALLYAVALHRYLRWRVPGYDPDAHLAGVLYLFVRGLHGADTPVVDGMPCGVFAWRPPRACVEALSDALDRGGPA